MHKLLNFFSFPTAIFGLILASSGLLGINSSKIEIHSNINNSNQIKESSNNSLKSPFSIAIIIINKLERNRNSYMAPYLSIKGFLYIF